MSQPSLSSKAKSSHFLPLATVVFERDTDDLVKKKKPLDLLIKGAMVKAFYNLLTVENTKENLKITKCTVKALHAMLAVTNTTGIGWMTKETAKA